jgi:hypothetical protein
MAYAEGLDARATAVEEAMAKEVVLR